LSEKISKQVVEYAAAYKSYVMAKPFSEERLVQLLNGICVQSNEGEGSSDEKPLSLNGRDNEEVILLKSRIEELEGLLAQANAEIKDLKGLS
jgi:hypothetical protein